MPIVLSPLPLLSSLTLVEKQNWVVGASLRDPFTKKGNILAHAGCFHLFFFMIFDRCRFIFRLILSVFVSYPSAVSG